VLSEEPLDNLCSLAEIAEATDNGACSGMFLADKGSEVVSGRRMAKLLIAQGSDSEFFQLDEKGNDVEG
jgi:hypothetical protein